MDYQNSHEIEIHLPVLHDDQVKAFWHLHGAKKKAIRCGRRWGKTEYGKTVGCNATVKGRSVGWFSPDYKIQLEAFNEMLDLLAPVVTSHNHNLGVIRTRNGGRVDFWSLENERAGRSRKYHLVIIDEAAFTKPNMMSVWNLAIQPTLLDYNGECLALSNTNGIESDNFFYQICNDPKHGFREYHAPYNANPLLPLQNQGESNQDWLVRREEMLERTQREHHPLVYKQEYLAEFVDWSGISFFSLPKLLADGLPVITPTSCDTVFAIIDSATKTGRDNDGTAVLYVAYDRQPHPHLTILDWDIQQIEGSLLEHWLPGVVKRCEELAVECRARMGSSGIWIEDKASGMVLIQQSQRRNMKVHAIDSKLTSVGKSERAISISGYVFRDLVKLSQYAFEKVVSYKGSLRNHLVTQITGFRIGNKDQVDDDLLDTFCYAVAIALGDQQGF